MSGRLFNFDPSKYADHFAKEGYAHIKGGVTQEFYDKMVRQVEDSQKSKLMKEFAIGDKQQSMYAFPDDGVDYAQELCDTISKVVGVPSGSIVLSERHVKGYEANAASEPSAHKDRYASEFSVGLSVHVKDGSTLVLYPYDELDINPFNTSQALRASLSPDRHPEPKLKKGRRIEIKDSARDVIVFRGHKIWHLRANPALTTMLYFKMNSFHCDPLGEDRKTEAFRQQTLANAELPDAQLEETVPLLGRRVDYFHTMYSRDWTEIPGVVLWGEKHFSVDDHEMKFVRAIDTKRNVGAIARGIEGADRGAVLAGVRRLARRGVIDLVSPGGSLK